ncbi:MAG: tetratricopeptide repeat protein, partial [Fibrobacterota bacterium]
MKRELNDIIRIIKSLYKKGLYKEMNHECLDCLRNFSESDEILFLTGASFLRLGDIRKASEYLEQAVSKAPEKLQYRIPLINIYRENKNRVKCLINCLEALKRAPGKPELLVETARCYLEASETDKALHYINKAAESGVPPDFIERFKSEVLYTADRFEDALEHAKSAVRISGETPMNLICMSYS